jgi:hypothetical protein
MSMQEVRSKGDVGNRGNVAAPVARYEEYFIECQGGRLGYHLPLSCSTQKLGEKGIRKQYALAALHVLAGIL